MPNDATLSIIVKLQDEASAGLAAIAGKVQAASQTIGSSIQNVGSSFSNLGTRLVNAGESIQYAGQKMTIGLTLPLSALGYAVVETSTKFQASMELIRTQAGATQGEVDTMTKAVLALAKSGETGQGPQALADGLYHIESLGYRGAKALDLLKTSAQAADLGLADMEGVTNALGAAIVTGIHGTETMNEAMGLLDATIGQGNMRMNDLVAALGTGVLPVAKNFGLSLQDVGAALATLTDNGMRADEAATRLRMSFSLMAAPTGKATKVFESIGLSQLQLAEDMRNGGIVRAMEDLKSHLDATGFSASQQAEVLSKAFGGGRSDAAILTLLEQLDRLKMKYDAIGASAGTFAEKVAATHETNTFKLNAALAQMQVTLIDLGATVMPMVAQMLQVLSGWMEKFTAWWDKLNPSTQQWIIKGLALLAILGPILVIIGSLVTALGVLSTGLGNIIWAFGKLVTTVAGGEATMGAFAIAAAPWLVVLAALAAAVYLVANAFGALQDEAAGALQAANQLDAISKKLDPLIANATGAKKAQLQTLQSQSQAVSQYASATAERYTGAGGILNALADRFAPNLSSAPTLPSFDKGGIVPGMSGAAVPIIAHAGEHVIPANQVGKQSSVFNLYFHFNDAVAGDDGIRQIITRTISTLNRETLIRAFAGV